MLRTLTLAAAVAVSPLAALAQVNTELTNCMLQQTTAADEQLLKDFMILALQEAPPDQLSAKFTEFSLMMVDLASSRCGIPLSQLENPANIAGVERYGQILGERLFAQALSRIGG